MAEARTGVAVALDGHSGNKVNGGKLEPLLRHPAPVAVIAAAFGAVAFAATPFGAEAILAAFTAGVLVVLAARDLERRIIPNRVVLPAIVIALVANIAISPGHSSEFVLATVAIGVIFLIPSLINASLMGMGDVKLMMLLGASLGSGVVGAVMIASFCVFPFALGALIRGGRSARKATLPFGPFLAVGGLVILIAPHLLGLR